MTVSPQVLKKKANAALKEADRLGLNLKPFGNKSGFKYIRKHNRAKSKPFIAEVAGLLCQGPHNLTRINLGRFDTAEEAALVLAKHLANIDKMRTSGTMKKNAIDVST